MTGQKTNVDLNDDARTIVITRTFAAPRDRVFRAFTDPQELAQWWGPEGWTTETHAHDLRPGGLWHYCMRGPDGMESWGTSTYHEVTPPARYVYSDAFSDAKGNPVEGMPTMTITTEFTEQGGKTLVTSTTQFASEEDMRKVVAMGVATGITQTWERLAVYLGGE